MPYFQYHQNNSGGYFVGPCDIIVEADSADEANDRAARVGIYFDGVGDCSCCGDRWYRAVEPMTADDFAFILRRAADKPMLFPLS